MAASVSCNFGGKSVGYSTIVWNWTKSMNEKYANEKQWNEKYTNEKKVYKWKVYE